MNYLFVDEISNLFPQNLIFLCLFCTLAKYHICPRNLNYSLGLFKLNLIMMSFDSLFSPFFSGIRILIGQSVNNFRYWNLLISDVSRSISDVPNLLFTEKSNFRQTFDVHQERTLSRALVKEGFRIRGA